MVARVVLVIDRLSSVVPIVILGFTGVFCGCYGVFCLGGLGGC